jgi:histidine triad (HIT) family protein
LLEAGDTEMTDCLFCKIRDREIPAEIVYEDDAVLAFNDVNPQAPVHVLIIPKKHISTVNDMTAGDSAGIGQLYLAAKAIAAKSGIDEDGYRLVVNCNPMAGQTVYHIHLHLLGGRRMTWPPG